jgi:hypothetical protein
MTQLFTNRASAKLAAPVAPSDTTITLQSGQGAEMPSLSGSDFFIGTLQSIDGSAIEIVKVTARSSDTLTVTRAQESTSAGTFAIGEVFDLRLTAGGLAGLAAGTTPPFGACFDGAGLPLTLFGATKVRYGPIKADGTVSKVALVADQAGSVTIGVKKCARSSYPGSLADVTGGHDVVLSLAAQTEDSTLTGWTTSFSADDIFEFELKVVDGVLKQISVLIIS